MKTLILSLLLLFVSLSFGCSALVITDEGATTRGQGLSAEQCKDRCKSEFHQCRNSPDRGGGPGASACAHQKNDCERRC